MVFHDMKKFMRKIKFGEMFLKSPRAISQLVAKEYCNVVSYVGGLRLSSKILRERYYLKKWILFITLR